jgi:Tfp pilus assembly protein PilN
VRPVNLIPPEERRGGAAPARTGKLSYFVIGALAALLLGVTAVVLTNKQISNDKAELATAKEKQAIAEARLKSLTAFTTLQGLTDKRFATVTSLAKSRFDWERVLSELARILPDDVWLVNVTGTVRPDVQVENGAEIDTRASVTGPALEIIGCATSQDAVARFVTDLQDIDGVTRVGVKEAKRPEQSTGSVGAAGPTEQSADDCRTRDSVVRFQMVVAFDEVPVPAEASAGGSAAPAPSGSTAGSSTTEASDSGVSQTQAQEAAAKQSAATQTEKAQKATNYAP